MAPESNLETKYAKEKVNTKFKGDISPSGAGALKHADALDAQKKYTLGNHNSGGGRTEKTRDRVKWQQIVRSENDNRTGARGRKITTGMASADGWTTFHAKRQVAAIEMRVGQNGGPLPSEAIIDLGAPIINNVQEMGTKLTATVRDASALKSQHESVHFRNRRTLRAFFATKRRLRRNTCKKRPKLGYVSGDEEKDATVERCRKGLRLGRAVRNANKGKPDRVLHLRVASLRAGEAQVEAEGDEVTLPVEEPMTAATL